MAGVLAVTVAVVALCGSALASDVHRTELRPASDSDDLLVVLIIGSDIGWPYRSGDPRNGNADAIHLIAVDTRELRATVVDIPRDSVVGGTKVNAHLLLGGPDRLTAQLESFTGVTIDHWMLTSFRGFERITEAIGGIDVVVDRPMHDDASNSDFDPGDHRVEGEDALAFARDRHSLPDGDIGRTRHQGELLIGAHRRIARDDPGLGDLVDLMGAVARHTASDIRPTRLLRLGLLATRIDPSAVEQVALTGRLDTLGGASVVRLRTRGVFERIRAGDVGPPPVPIPSSPM
jgi:LCP family protein required for cell wall assembly